MVFLFVMSDSVGVEFDCLQFKDRYSNEFKLSKIAEIPNPGCGVESVRFFSEKNANTSNNKVVLISYSDGSLLNVNLKLKEESIFFVKPKMKKKGFVSFKIVDVDIRRFLLRGSNGKLYFSSMDLNLIELPGKYDNGRILNPNVVVAWSRGTFHILYFSCDGTKREFKFGKNNPMNIHYDDVTYTFTQEKFAVLTTSKDTTIKMFFVMPRPDIDEADFDRTDLDIKNMCIIDNKHAISFGESE